MRTLRVSFMRCVALCMVAAATLACCGGSRGDGSGTDASGAGVLDLPETIRAHVEYLAADEREGRLIGSEGIAEAEEYIAGQFQTLGLEPLPGDDDYFQDFTVRRAAFRPDELRLEIGDGDYVGTAALDFSPLRYCGAGDVRSELVFAGYGISAPSLGWDDYSGLDVRGKIVLVLRGEPDTSDPSSPFYGEASTVHAYFQTKGEIAHRLGAAAIIVVNSAGREEHVEDFAFRPSYALEGLSLPPGRGGQVRELLPALLSSSKLLVAAAAAWGVSPDELKRSSDAGVAPRELGLVPLDAHITVGEPERTTGVPARNVAAIIPGRSGAGYVVVGAHHDHLGVVDDGAAEAAGGEAAGAGDSTSSEEIDTIFNGADDNASGVAAILAAAATLADERMNRSVIFVTFTGEEQDLLGSIWFVASGAINVQNVDLMLNADMVGRNPTEPVIIYQGGEMPFAGQSLASLAADVGLDAHVVTSGFGGSDYTPFQMSGVPVVFPFSGFHPDYHGVDDEVDRIDFDRLAEVSEFIVSVVKAAAAR